MRLRYQMRGLGVGIVVTALLMGVAMGDKIPLSDAEIRAKAMELGMVDGNSLTLADVGNSTNNPTPAPSPGTGAAGQSPGPGAGTPEPSAGPESDAQTPEPDSSAGTPGTSAPEPGTETTSSPESEPGIEPGEVTGWERDGQMITLVVEPGDGSYTICKRLEAAGLVDDAASFDTYLCDIGYSRKIRDGTYKILIGTSEEEIAKIITKNQ